MSQPDNSQDATKGDVNMGDTTGGITSTETTAPAQESAEQKDSIKVLINRVTREDGPALCIPYDDGSGKTQRWYPEADKSTFEVEILVAIAACETGFFSVDPKSKTQLK